MQLGEQLVELWVVMRVDWLGAVLVDWLVVVLVVELVDLKVAELVVGLVDWLVER